MINQKAKSSLEMAAVPEILDILDVKHATITIDALNTQKDIAAKIISKEADYALAVKDNHKNLRAGIEQAFDTNSIDETNKEAYFETTDKGHGQIEVRCDHGYLFIGRYFGLV